MKIMFILAARIENGVIAAINILNALSSRFEADHIQAEKLGISFCLINSLNSL
jgi:hypothetical protein